MARDRRRTIYNHDAASVEETVSMNDEMKVVRKEGPKTVQVSDVIETYPTYFGNYEFEPDALDKSTFGECIICGEKTSKKSRKVCIKCIKAYKNDLYDGMQKAISSGESSFTFFTK